MRTIAYLFTFCAGLWAQPDYAVRFGRGAEDHVAGKPYSATAVTHTVQTLADGSHIDRTSTKLFWQDGQGRYRIEIPGEQPRILIADTVTGTMYNLNTDHKTALKRDFDGFRAAEVDGDVSPLQDARAMARQNRNLSVEDLGKQVINGVTALGVRLTTTIPVGAIGNDRELKSVTERWYSNDIHALVKTATNDPRTGVDTYELIHIVRAEPDAALFQVPAGFTITSARQE